MQKPLIKTNQALQDFCAQLDPQWGIAIDTEFMRQKTYYAIPALLQVAQQQDGKMVSACIDATTIEDWTSLQSSLEQSAFCLTHSPDQDFEIFDLLFEAWDFSIYDTQVATALLGEQPQISYAAMIKMTLGLEIDKSQSRTDWLKRPLSNAQLDYALADVIHLPPAWSLLEEKLKVKDRIDWFYADCTRQIAEHKASDELASAWRRVKGIKRLNQNGFAIAASLAHWREQKAMSSDRPRRWILADDVILDLAMEPRRLQELSNVHKILNRNFDEIKAILKNPNTEYQQLDINIFSPLTGEEKKRYTSIKQYCNSKAEELSIDPATLSNRKTLEKIARGWHDFLDMNNWRHQVLQDYINEYV